MKKDKTRLILMAVLTVTLLIGVALYAFTMTDKEKASPGNMVSLLIPVIVVVFMVFFISRRYRDIKQGLPFEDERSKKVVTHAAAKSFYVSLYWLLLISWFEDFFASRLFGIEQLTASQTIGGGIAGMAVFFFIFWLYYDKKGKLV